MCNSTAFLCSFPVVYGGSLWYLTCGNAAAFATAFGALPILLKFPLKAAWVVPNAYHAMNGLRHLVRRVSRSVQQHSHTFALTHC